MSDDSAVHGHVARVFGGRAVDEDIARVHVGVKKAIPKYLSEKDLHAALGKQLDIYLLLLERRNIAYRHAIYPFADHDLLAGERPVHFGYIDQVTRFKVASQLRRVSRFTLQVEFAVNDAVIFSHNLDGPQPSPSLRPA